MGEAPQLRRFATPVVGCVFFVLSFACLGGVAAAGNGESKLSVGVQFQHVTPYSGLSVRYRHPGEGVSVRYRYRSPSLSPYFFRRFGACHSHRYSLGRVCVFHPHRVRIRHHAGLELGHRRYAGGPLYRPGLPMPRVRVRDHYEPPLTQWGTRPRSGERPRPIGVISPRRPIIVSPRRNASEPETGVQRIGSSRSDHGHVSRYVLLKPDTGETIRTVKRDAEPAQAQGENDSEPAKPRIVIKMRSEPTKTRVAASAEDR